MSVAGTYAEALFESAEGSGAVDGVARDLAAFTGAVEESEELREAIENPEVDRRAKRRIIDALMQGAVSHPHLTLPTILRAYSLDLSWSPLPTTT